jgi:hypothetical protein
MSTHLRITVLLILGTALLFGYATPKALADACASPLSPAITNSCVVVPGALWRGAKPDVDGATALILLGVKTVVNLELLHDDIDAFRAARPSTALTVSIDYFRIRDWEPNVVIAPALLDSHVSDFIAIVKTQAKPIYVHCRSGQNRTGVMIAAYRVLLEDVSIESAIAEMQKYQGWWFKQDAEYLRSLSGEHRERIEKMAEARIGQIRPDAHLVCSASGCNKRK